MVLPYLPLPNQRHRVLYLAIGQLALFLHNLVTVQYFANSTNALGAFTAPIAGGPGNRNIWNLDVARLKDFKMPWSDSHKLQFRTDAINACNHVNFSNPGTNIIIPATFGNITSDVNGPRVSQLRLRYIF